jgi:alpha-ketoglutarate-dependent taurine dioxygenase
LADGDKFQFPLREELSPRVALLVTAPKEQVLKEGQQFAGRAFPLALGPSSADSRAPQLLAEWLREHKSELDDLLLSHKAILFRGYDVLTAADFNDIVEASGFEDMEYTGGAAVRTQITARVFTANESPSSEKIPYHHELAQTPLPPTHVFFYCEQPPETGGATPILPSGEVYRRMQAKHPDFIEKLETLGVRYCRIMPRENDPSSAIGRGWKATFNAETIQEAEAALSKLGSDWEWLPGDAGELRTVTALVPGVRTYAKTGEKTFFNSVVAAYTGWNDSRNVGQRAVQLGDGSFVGEEEMQAAQEIMAEVEVAFAWQRGDVLLLDNRTVMHSRQPFSGGRRILASLARDSVR